MKKMYPTTPILTTPKDRRSIATMNTGRLLRNAYLTSRDDYPSSLLPYNPGLGDLWISSIHQHDYAMQFIKGGVLPYVVSPIAKVNYWDGELRADIPPQWTKIYYIFEPSRLYIPTSVYILAVLSISSLKKYAKGKNDLLHIDIIRETVAKIVANGEAERYAVGFYKYTGFHKEPDFCDLYFFSFWDTIYWLNVAKHKAPAVFSKIIDFVDGLSSIIFNLVVEANAQYPIKKLEGKYGKEYYYKSGEFRGKLTDDTKFYKIDDHGRLVIDKINKYFMSLDLFKIRIREE
jgi:hypothetical protein